MTLVVTSQLAMRAAPGALARWLAPWAHAYGDSKALATVVTFVHIAALLMAGGLAVATDRSTLRALRLAAEARASHLDELAGIHRLVLGGLVLAVLSGLLLFASDVDTFLGSWIFWTKMALVLLLLANGYRMTRVERALRGGGDERSLPWTRLRHAAITSIALWYVVTLAGVALANVP